jgi:hypothetical protein
MKPGEPLSVGCLDLGGRVRPDAQLHIRIDPPAGLNPAEQIVPAEIGLVVYFPQMDYSELLPYAESVFPPRATQQR